MNADRAVDGRPSGRIGRRGFSAGCARSQQRCWLRWVRSIASMRSGCRGARRELPSPTPVAAWRQAGAMSRA